MKYSIGVDLGGTNIAIGLMDIESKKILFKESTKTRAPRSCESICDDICEMTHSLCKKQGIQISDIDWVGVATPGTVKSGVVIGANNLQWKNVNFAEILAKKLPRPVYIANDANAAAYAEAVWGCGVGESSVVAVTLGTGIGGGIVIDGKIWEGINGFAAEIGHMIIAANGRQCSCGLCGCLEAYCSATALVNETKRMMQLYPESEMWRIVDGDINRVNGITSFEAKRRGDEAAALVIKSFIDYLAIGIANVINVFQPAVACVGGGISGQGEELMAPLRERIKHITFGTKDCRTRVEAAKFRNDAGIIGAGLLGIMEEKSVDNINKVQSIFEKFSVDGEYVSDTAYGNGHINDTRLIETKCGDDKRLYVLQKINKNVFRRPDLLMENYVNVTAFIREKIVNAGGDPDREVLNVIKAKDGKDYVIDENGDYWRLLIFVTNSLSYDKVERPEQFYDSAVAFGNFQYMLRDYPASTLHETIVNFHNTPDRYNNLMAAVEKNACGRLSEVKAEVEFCRARSGFAGALERAHKEGKLPLKVTHNDTKLNNILFDKESGKSLCVVDLDTIMPGYSVNDFGDSIRFGATTALEDEKDLTKVNFDIGLYELYVKGFIEGAKGGLSEGEIELLPIGAIMMTFECGMRFLTDYLNGDTYFRTHRPGQNLDRARNQFKLVSDMEKALPEMQSIVAKYAK